MAIKHYLLSFPERLLRATLGLGAGMAREVGVLALPEGVRRSQLYQNLVDTTLRFLIEQVGGVEDSPATEQVPETFLPRTAGNAVEVLGLVAFRASPVWVLAALADVCGMGRHLNPEIADALRAQGLLGTDAQFTTVDELLDGLEQTSSRLAATINTPPLDVAGLRQEWQEIRESPELAAVNLPSARDIADLWGQLKADLRDRTDWSLKLVDDGGLPLVRASRRRAVAFRVRAVGATYRPGLRGSTPRSLHADVERDPRDRIRDLCHRAAAPVQFERPLTNSRQPVARSPNSCSRRSRRRDGRSVSDLRRPDHDFRAMARDREA